MKLTTKTVKDVAKQLLELTESAQQLYLSDKEISPELADALGEMWDLCQDYISVYENYSRE